MPKPRPVSITPVTAAAFRGAGDPSALAVVGFDATVGQTRSVASSFIAGRLAPVGTVDPTPAVTTDTMTVVNGTSATINGRVENANSENFTILGRKGNWVSGATDVDGAFTGREFYANGAFEFSWKARGTDSGRFWIFVDGVPTTTAPFQPAGTTTAGATYYQKVTPDTNVTKRRKYTVYASRISAWGAFRFTATTVVQATAPRALMTSVGASLGNGFTTGNNNNALQALEFTLARLLGMDIQIASQESTGFLAAGGTQTYGDPARIARGTERTPDIVSFTGSGNDLGLLTLADYRAAVKACFKAWAVALPTTPFIVFGIPPRNATDTISADMAARNNILREEALANENVIAFHDMIGLPTDTPPAAWSSGTAYGPGDRVTYLGSVWRVAPQVVGTASNIVPGTSERWTLDTWAYSGTGKVGATVGDGTRDVLLANDGTHPEAPAGFVALAQRAERAFRDSLAGAVG